MYAGWRHQLILPTGHNGHMRCAPRQYPWPHFFFVMWMICPPALIFHISLYADDSALIFSGKDVERMWMWFPNFWVRNCRPASSGYWLIDNRLSLHVGKTESILFGTSRKIKKAGGFEVKCDGETVLRVTSVVYLGVRLDQCLNFYEYVKL